MANKETNPQKEYAIFGPGFGVLVLLAGIAGIVTIDANAPPIMDIPRNLALGLPLAILGLLFIASGVLIFMNKVAGVHLMIVTAVLLLTADLYLEIGTFGTVFAFKLMSIVIYAIPLMIIYRSGKVIDFMNRPENATSPDTEYVHEDATHRTEDKLNPFAAPASQVSSPRPSRPWTVNGTLMLAVTIAFGLILAVTLPAFYRRALVEVPAGLAEAGFTPEGWASTLCVTTAIFGMIPYAVIMGILLIARFLVNRKPKQAT